MKRHHTLVKNHQAAQWNTAPLKLTVGPERRDLQLKEKTSIYVRWLDRTKEIRTKEKSRDQGYGWNLLSGR